MYFSFSLFARQRERKVPKERENTPSFPTTLRLLNKMDTAGEPALLRSLKNARGANVVQDSILFRNFSKSFNFL